MSKRLFFMSWSAGIAALGIALAAILLNPGAPRAAAPTTRTRQTEPRLNAVAIPQMQLAAERVGVKGALAPQAFPTLPSLNPGGQTQPPPAQPTAAPPQSAPTGSSRIARVVTYQFLDDDGNPIDLYGEFPAETKTFGMQVIVNSPETIEVKGVWLTDDVPGWPSNTEISSGVGSASNAQNGLRFTLQRKNGEAWPPGAYRFELYVDDKPETTIKFRVAGAETQPSAQTTPGASNAPNSAATAIVYQDDFSDCSKMWTGENERLNYTCAMGAYYMTRKVADSVGMSLIEGNFDNATFTVDGFYTALSTPSEYGLLFRMNSDGNSGYGAGVYEGKYTIFRFDDGKVQELVPYTPNPNIKSGSAEANQNTIQVAAYGDQIALYVNGAHITTVTDKTYSSGAAGLYVYGKQTPLDAVFDNLVIAKFNQPPTFPSASNQDTAPTSPSAESADNSSGASQNPCQVGPDEAGFLISNGYAAVMRFTIGGGQWGTHDYDVPADGKLYLIVFPPGRYTYTASVPGVGADHGEPYDYKGGTCRKIDYGPGN